MKETMQIKWKNLILKCPLPPDISSDVASIEKPEKQEAINSKKTCFKI